MKAIIFLNMQISFGHGKSRIIGGRSFARRLRFWWKVVSIVHFGLFFLARLPPAVSVNTRCQHCLSSFRDEKIRSFIWRNMESGDGREGNRKEEITINEDSNRVGVAANWTLGTLIQLSTYTLSIAVSLFLLVFVWGNCYLSYYLVSTTLSLEWKIRQHKFPPARWFLVAKTSPRREWFDHEMLVSQAIFQYQSFNQCMRGMVIVSVEYKKWKKTQQLTHYECRHEDHRLMISRL